MSNQRKEIIIKELNYWKENKLLPSVYCDFLLALYTEGEASGETNGTIEDEKPRYRLITLMQFFFLLMALLISLLIIYTFPLPVIWKSSLLLLILLLASMLYLFQLKANDQNAKLTIIIPLLLLIVNSLFMTTYFSKNQWLLAGVLTFNFFLWFFISRKVKLKYLTVISVLAMLVTGSYVIYRLFVS